MTSPITKVTLVDAIVKEMENRILNKDLQPGDKLPSERILAQQLGVGRYALREAIRKLEAKGLLTTQSGKGTFVNKNSADSFVIPLTSILLFEKHEIFNLLEVRRFLE
ncbi:MAG: GntR family transcriptional regulator, partial [Deinococcus sp.]|nr:GntR family transcriptional regulator [Deinococcus sp.]